MQPFVAILGDGQMALVLADALAQRSVPARLWSPFAADAAALAAGRVSSRLAGFRLADSVQITGDESRVFDRAGVIISAIPTQFLRSAWSRLKPHVPPDAAIVSVTKGIEIDTLQRPSEVIQDVLGCGGSGSGRAAWHGSLCVLSGPSIAAELARHQPATLIAASRNEELARHVQALFNVPWLRIYRLDDVAGVEIAGAAKNVIALAAGMVDGLGAGDNAKSALLARGLAEIARLGVALGARVDTFFGVAGVGDLATTCFSPEGRNRTCGERLAKGEPLDAVLKSMSSVVEGVPTTRAVLALARRHGVEMPITAAVHAILFEGKTPREAIRDLMSRELKAEQVG